MDNLILKSHIDDNTTLYVTPIDITTYEEHDEDRMLGGSDGYFILKSNPKAGIELLAKAPTFDAAGVLFDMIVSGLQKDRVQSW